jgi:hypothetical protein
VYAVNAAAASDPSNQVTIAVPATPIAPTNLILTIQGALPPQGPRVRLNFRDNQNGGNPETGFQIWRSDNGGPFNLLATAPPRAGVGSTTYFDYAVVGGNTYAYYVVTINAGSASLPTSTMSVTLPAIPAAPSSFLGTTRLTGGGFVARIDMTWVDNSTNESRFVVQRASDAAFTTDLVVVNRLPNTTTMVVTNLPRGTTYYFRIRTENLYGVSAWVNLDPFPITTP